MAISVGAWPSSLVVLSWADAASNESPPVPVLLRRLPEQAPLPPATCPTEPHTSIQRYGRCRDDSNVEQQNKSIGLCRQARLHDDLLCTLPYVMCQTDGFANTRYC